MRRILLAFGVGALFITLIAFVKVSIPKVETHKEEIEFHPVAENVEMQKVTPLPMPSFLTFSGEEVPLKYFDVRERLERELAVNVFWHSSTFIAMKRANRFLPQISKILKQQGLPDDLKYIPLIESGLTNAISPAKATGFWQFLDGTAKEFGLEVNSEVDERYHWKKSTEAACRYFKWLHSKYDSWTLSAAAYNCGRTALNRQIELQKHENYYSLLLPEETERYVFRALAFKLILSDPKRYGYYLEYQDLYPYIDTDEVIITETIGNLAQWAIEKGLTYRELKYFNPWLRTNTLTIKGNKKYAIELPCKNYRHNYTHLLY
jgi:hypothetical protein